MGANPACNVDPLGLQFNPGQSMPQGGGIPNAGVGVVEGQMVIFGAWAMGGGRSAAMQSLIDKMAEGDFEKSFNREVDNALSGNDNVHIERDGDHFTSTVIPPGSTGENEEMTNTMIILMVIGPKIGLKIQGKVKQRGTWNLIILCIIMVDLRAYGFLQYIKGS